MRDGAHKPTLTAALAALVFQHIQCADLVAKMRKIIQQTRRDLNRNKDPKDEFWDRVGVALSTLMMGLLSLFAIQTQHGGASITLYLLDNKLLEGFESNIIAK